MKKYYSIELSKNGINELKQGLKEYRKWVKQKSEELAERLAEIGVAKAQVNFAAAYYEGNEDSTVTAEKRDNGYAVVAKGTTVLFVEFGAGIIGGGHPEENGMTPGSYSDTVGRGQWSNPEGWIYQHDKPRSHGNPANMPMYNSMKEVEMELERVAREVLEL